MAMKLVARNRLWYVRNQSQTTQMILNFLFSFHISKNYYCFL